MSFLVLRFAALVIVPAIAASARPALTFFGAQMLAAALIARELLLLPEGLMWLVSGPTMGLAAALALVETLANQDSDLALILSELSVERVAGVLSGCTTALLMAMLGAPEEEAAAYLGPGGEGLEGAADMWEGLAVTLSVAEGPGWSLAAVGTALGVTLVVTKLRGELLTLFREMSLGGVWAVVEMGGVIGVLILLPFLPILVLVAVLSFLIAVAVVAKVLRVRAEARDRKARVACEVCGEMIRREALICKGCGAEVLGGVGESVGGGRG